MVPRMRTAGTTGIVAGVALAIGFILFITSGLTFEAFADPGQGLKFATTNAGRLRLMTAFFITTVAFAAVFLAGLAAKLRDKTPTRATATLYLGLLGLAGHGLGALIFWAAIPAIAARAATDQVAASHAWVALVAMDNAADGFGTLFVALSTLMAGWAVITSKALSAALGWYGVLLGVVGVLAFLASGNEILGLASFVLPIIWLVWAGSALRRAM